VTSSLKSVRALAACPLPLNPFAYKSGGFSLRGEIRYVKEKSRHGGYELALRNKQEIAIIATVVTNRVFDPLSSGHPMKRSTRSVVQSEIKQSRRFRSAKQEATIALLRTASVVRRAIGRVLEPYGLSTAQYNALRIIRGAGLGGIPTLDIRERMIEEGTTITRLLDKLENAKLIHRERSLPDRRQVICHATAEGKKLLDRIDPIVNAADEEAVTRLSPGQLQQFIETLDLVRAANAERGAPRTMARTG
jgi:MarR family transcriptional regulator, organic hydroperoxide resistance regulator